MFKTPVRIAALLFAVSLLAGPSLTHAAVLDADRVAGFEIGLPGSPPAIRKAAPDVGMAAGVLVTSDGRELWARFPDDERAMASTTKVMTAIVVVENVSLDERVTISAEAARVGEAASGIAVGKTYTVRKLLEAMLVRSGNDAAAALAEHVGGSVDGFARMMNVKGQELDLRSSHFKNPHGLDEEGHRSSAADLATMSRYAMGLPEFRRIVTLPRTTVAGRGGSVVTLENSNKLLTSYAGANGVKTGWTDRAGYCVVGSAERDGVELVAVILGSQSESTRFSYARRLLDWGFEHYRMTELAREGDRLGAVPVSDFIDIAVPVTAGRTERVAVFDLAGPVSTQVDVVPSVRAPVAKGQQLGMMTVTQTDRLLAQIPIVAVNDVAAPGFWERVSIGASRLWRSLFGGQLVAPAVPAPA